MFEFLKSKRPINEPPLSVAAAALPPQSTQQHSNVRHELVRVVLKDTLRLHGIPTSWMACDVIVMTRPGSEEALHIQLIVMKWNEQLLRYGPALQQQLLHGLDRFDPSVDHSGYIVSWRFSPECGCPFSQMPDPASWLPSALPATIEEPASVLDRRHTRRPPNAPRLNPAPSGAQEQSSDYLPTQIAPLR